MVHYLLQLLGKFSVQINSEMFRAEFMQNSEEHDRYVLTDKEAKKLLLQYMQHNGVTASHATVKEYKNIQFGIVRGTKLLEEGEEEIAITYESHIYFGNNGWLALSVGAPSNRFPTSKIHSFLSSVTFTGD